MYRQWKSSDPKSAQAGEEKICRSYSTKKKPNPGFLGMTSMVKKEHGDFWVFTSVGPEAEILSSDIPKGLGLGL